MLSWIFLLRMKAAWVNFMEERFQSIGQKFGDDFVSYVAKAYKSKLISKMRATDLGNES